MFKWFIRNVLVMLAMSVGATAAHAGPGTIVVQAGALLERADAPMRGPSAILIRDGVITAVADAAEPVVKTWIEAGACVIDWRERTVLPGLVDAHVHLAIEPGEAFWTYATRAESDYALIAAANARRTLAAGFTTVRDVYSPPNAVRALRDAIARGEAIGPRIVVSGPGLSIIGGHGDNTGFNREVTDAIAQRWRNTCTGPVECAARVRELSRDGADVIKITATGGVLSQQDRGLDEQFSLEEMRAIVDTAHALGLKVAAHAHGAGGIRAALTAGVDSIEHGTLIDAEGARMLRERRAALVPTLMVFTGLREGLAQDAYGASVAAKARKLIAESEGASVRTVRAAKGKIAFGTDAGVFGHGRNAEEFALLVSAGGMTSREALASSITTAAELLGLGREIGRIQPGYRADLIAVRGDPLTDVKVLQHVEGVIANGALVQDHSTR